MHPFLNSDAISFASFSPIDKHFADFLARTSFDDLVDGSSLNQAETRKLITLFAQLSQTQGQQNSCLTVADAELVTLLTRLRYLTVVPTGDLPLQARCKTPLVLVMQSDDQALLYSNRFFTYENRIAQNLSMRNQPAANTEQQLRSLSSLFTNEDDPKQKVAAIIAATRQLAIVSGGPGTGKTSTVVKILAALLMSEPTLRIQLAAPTGKAAMRLTESIGSAASKLENQLASEQSLQIPTQVSTLHRLLRLRGDNQSYFYHKDNQLPVDVLILDEASMIDLVMFDRVLQALPSSSRLVILGDPAQLPSVDVGTVLADLTLQGECFRSQTVEQIKQVLGDTLPQSLEQELTQVTHRGGHKPKLIDAHCMLKTSYRFKDDEGIGQLAHILRSGTQTKWDELSQTLAVDGQVELKLQFDQSSVIDEMRLIYAPYIKSFHDQNIDAIELLNLFDKAQLLTPVREGEFGVSALNTAFEQLLGSESKSYYHGKPVMVMKNHYGLRLFNGDIGVCVQRGDSIEVAFRNSQDSVDFYLPARLPEHETCYAITVHKSQGSEFDRVCLILPETDRAEFVNRELIYTGVTRAKHQLSVLGSIASGSRHTNSRLSGLAHMLQARTSEPNEDVASSVSQNDGAIEVKSGQGTDQLDLF